ncbi:metallophosphoesterase [Ancylobacter sp. Lp-2]|uniref:metallophosphoesterase n=1 Tax=Ancylobacter sp. Lp-2 TaxID=2881339 RepID=UPI001E423034|nr:metallophosphoesterase [Ancylobacter sp. Lp-2]MCB4767104.1 metallophosphoesterase [Ancylobacter sp. Lp-2]
MTRDAVFLHVTDSHLDGGIQVIKRDDHKEKIQGIDHATRDHLLKSTFERVAEILAARGISLAGVIFSGDATDKSKLEGHIHLYELILSSFGRFGVSTKNIVAVPGNHDVVRGSKPSSRERYERFNKAWRETGCITPWLDGLDTSFALSAKHSLASSDGDWLIAPINSSNWSQIRLDLTDKSLAAVWDKLHEIPELDALGQAAVREGLDGLLHADMARVSEEQLEYVRKLIATSNVPTHGHQLRIVVLHHHLRSPGLREEVKPFADLTNLTLLRTFIRQQRIDVVIHGHKHESTVAYDYIDNDAGDDPHRTLVISGGSLIGEDGGYPVRLLTFKGMPSTPEVTVEEFGIPRGGTTTEIRQEKTRRLWQVEEKLPGGPVVLQGADIDVLYDRAIKVVADGHGGGPLIVHLDAEDAPHGNLPLPRRYEVPGIEDEARRQKWLEDLVRWWQEPHSKLAVRLPQAHGARMRRYGGKLDQVDRIKRLLQTKNTTRAIAILLDPFVDFEKDTTKEEFASFCLVQFTRRQSASIGPQLKGEAAKPKLDCIAYYRAQEFRQWWPINMAELRLVQRQISEGIGALPGRITTIAADARFISTAPMQAIVPIIDRWSDHAPETLHILANALLSDGALTARQEEVVEEWLLSLDNQLSATTAWNPDGMPVALEGLETLRSYLMSSEPATDDSKAICDLLARQITTNRTWTRSPREQTDFANWAPATKANLAEMRQLSTRRTSK